MVQTVQALLSSSLQRQDDHSYDRAVDHMCDIFSRMIFSVKKPRIQVYGISLTFYHMTSRLGVK